MAQVVVINEPTGGRAGLPRGSSGIRVAPHTSVTGLNYREEGGHAGTDGGYSIGFVTGSAGSHDRVDKLESTLRHCLGLAPIPATSEPPAGS